MKVRRCSCEISDSLFKTTTTTTSLFQIKCNLQSMCPQLAKIILVAAFVKCLHVNLAYKESHSDTSARRNRPQNIIWYNPPYSKKVETNIGKRFLSVIDLHFPKSNPLHKIFNRNTIKLSYSCMPNVRTIISNHNKSELNKPEQTDFIKIVIAEIPKPVSWTETVTNRV